MEPDAAQLITVLEPTTLRVASRLTRTYGAFVETADLAQELRTLIFCNTETVAALLTVDDPDDSEAVTASHRQAGTWLHRSGATVCRKIKADRLGYSPGDEYHYTPSLIAEMLPVLFHGDTDRVDDVNAGQVTTSNDPATSGETDALMADIAAAWHAAPDALLFCLYCKGDSHADLADRWGVAESTIYRRERAALRRMALELGAD